MALKTVCCSLVLELKRLHQHVPGLPIASAIADRMSYLLPPLIPQHLQTDPGAGPVDRSLMYSEAARRDTFSKWPHMNYRYPEQPRTQRSTSNAGMGPRPIRAEASVSASISVVCLMCENER